MTLASEPPPEDTSIHQGKCPTALELARSCQDREVNPNWESLATHLRECGDCETTLEELSDESNKGVDFLTSLPPAEEDEAEFRALYAQLVATPLMFCGDESMDDLDFADDCEDRLSDLELPAIVGQYRLIRTIGTGASGTVFLARHLELDRDVVIKLLSRRRSLDRSSVDRFRHEVRAIGQLEHPHIVRATDAGSQDGRHYLVMEYAAGASVSEILQTQGPLSVSDACEITRQAAMGLAYSHSQRMIHRDVKLSNMLLTSEGIVKLLDLGLVAFQTTEENTYIADGPRGTSDYMAPEQWTNFHTVDHRSDLYSLGCALFKLLTGAGPFSMLPEGFHSKRTAHLEAAPPDLGAFRADVPIQVRTLVNRLLAKSPVDRIQSAEGVAMALEKFCGGANLVALCTTAMASAADASCHDALRNEPTSPLPIYQRRRFLQFASAALGGGCLIHWWATRQSAVRGVASYGVDCSVWQPLTPVKPYCLPSAFDPLSKAAQGSADYSEIIEGSHSEEPESALHNHFTIAPVQDRPTLLLLGRPTRGALSLSVDIDQIPDQGNVGCFFGYRTLANSTTSYYTMRILTAVEPPRVAWHYFRFSAINDSEEMLEEPLADAVLRSRNDTVPDARSIRLQVTLGRSGMPEVHVQGRRVAEAEWKFSFEGRQRKNIAADRWQTAFLGQLGVVCQGGKTTIRDARLKYHAIS